MTNFEINWQMAGVWAHNLYINFIELKYNIYVIYSNKFRIHIILLVNFIEFIKN